MKKDRQKKIFLQKNGKKKKQITGADRHTQEKIETIFFWIFVILLIFFLTFGFYFCSTLLGKNRFCFVPFCTSTVYYIYGTNEYKLLPLV